MPVVPEEKLVEIDCPTLGELDKKVAREAMMAAIAFFSNTLNQQRQMVPEQIKVMAYDMVDEFPNDSVAFVKLFFKKLRSGAFGNIYGTVDELTILNLYRKYRNEIITKYPMRKKPPKQMVEDVKALQETNLVSMPDWFKEKHGISDGSIAGAVFSKPKVETNPSHSLYKEMLKNAKSQEERIAIMKEYLKEN